LSTVTQPEAFEDALRKPPKDMPDAYKKTMQRIEHRGPTDKDLALRTLAWIRYGVSLRPIKMEELRDLLLTRCGNKDIKIHLRSLPEDIVDVCEGLIVYDIASQTVRFTHFTVQEFFCTPERSSILPPVSELAKICLTYLTFDVFEEGPCRRGKVLKERLKKYKAAVYVACFWHFYAREAEQSEEIQSAIVEFLESANKRDAMLEMEEYADNQLIEFLEDETLGQTLLHVIAKKGLVATCRRVLKMFRENVRYDP
jgi:hypothetical protein